MNKKDTTLTSEAAKRLGRLGGRKTLEKYGPDHFKKITKGWPKGKKRGLNKTKLPIDKR